MSFKNDAIFWVEVDKIVPNPFQPRREFDEARLKELGDSIRQYGVLQPLTVTRQETPKPDGGIAVTYELIAGERRLRASKLAGVAQVPVIIRDGAESDRMKLELAIIENLQREDLNAVDRATAFKQLAEQFNLSHLQVGQKVGRSREYVSNSIRLLLLPQVILIGVQQGKVTEGHARTLLMLNDRPEEQNVLVREIILKKLSVREVERITRKIATDKVRKKEWGGLELEIVEIEKQFNEMLGTRVQIAKTDYGGKVVIDYFSPEDLHKILDMMAHGDKAKIALPTPTDVASSPALGHIVEEVVVSEEGLAEEVGMADIVSEGESVVAEAIAETVPVEVGEVVEETAVPEDDRPSVERQEEDDTDLYAIKNFSL